MTATPRLMAYAFAVLVAVVALIAVISFLSDPFGFKARKIERLERERDAAASRALADALSAEGQAAQIERIETAGRLTIDVQTVTAHAIQQAQEAPDANDPLSPDRAERLSAHDRSLCDIRPAVCAAPAAEPAPAGG